MSDPVQRGRRSVCIIGAGAAGLTLADALARAGWRVILVEGGGARPAPALEDTYRVTMLGTPHRGAHEGRFRALGGSTTRWGGQLWPWERHEFEPRPWLGLDGWPIAHDEVAPYYDAAFALLGIRRGSLTPDAAAAHGVQLPPLDPERFALKYSVWLPWRRRNLARVFGASLRGPSVDLRLGTTAVGIEMSGGRATGVRVQLPGGGEELIGADLVVIAAGAIETS
ncbi:MAG TPA: FAD-dependent oxidoreductase, partial [Gemmatimonadaceae bacterium]|nr:FAD-dependent oxidoreductase [Gemmatimonadaceae bacterium]